MQVQNCYKIKDATLETEITTPKQKDVLPRPVPNSAVKVSCETMEEAVRIAAYKIADAEEKSFLAAEAVDNAERLSKMAEDAESMLQLFKEIYEQCKCLVVTLCAKYVWMTKVFDSSISKCSRQQTFGLELLIEDLLHFFLFPGSRGQIVLLA